MKKIVLTEEQCSRILNETQVKERVVHKLIKELNKKYEATSTTYETKGGPKKVPMFKKIYDGDEIRPYDVLRDLNTNNKGISEGFIKQVITDWYNGVIDEENLTLSKNVRMK